MLPLVRLIFLLRFSAIFLLVSSTYGCITTNDQARQNVGIQPGYESFIPARVAVMPCRMWPQAQRFRAQPLSNAKDLEIGAFCQVFDSKVLEAFANQPYMNGFTPKYLTRIFDEASQGSLLLDVMRPWTTPQTPCSTCENAAAVYNTQIASLPVWQTWLAKFSRYARRADAILLPFITHAYTQVENDRGLIIANRAVGVTLLLIDTATGQLIWSGNRSVSLPNKKLATTSSTGELAPPEWSELEGLLFTEDLWREFPGRQMPG